MRVQMVRATVASGRPVSVGEVLDLSPDDARLLLALGKARPVAEDSAPVVSPVVVQHRDPKPSRRR